MPLFLHMRRAWLAAALLAIGVATLYPSPGEDVEPLVLCVLCGAQAASDALTNVILFIPFGAALALLGWRPRWAILTAGLLSCTVECAQLLVIPGRDPSLGDVLFNTMGGAVGVFVIRSASSWLLPAPSRARAYLGAAMVAAIGVFLISAWLFTPALPDSQYVGQWTPNLGHLEWYRGRVLEANLGTLPLPPRPLTDAANMPRALLVGTPLVVRAIAGPPTGAVASLFSIYDDHQREILLLGPDRADLVYRLRLRAAVLKLDQPDLRFLGAMRGIRRGDTLTTIVRHEAGGWCLSLNHQETCGAGFTLGRAWAFLMYPEGFPDWLRRLLDVGWMAGVLLPFGLWVRHDRVSWAASGLLLAGLLLGPANIGLRALSAIEFCGALGGIAGGTALRWLASRAPSFVTPGPRWP